MFEKTKNDFEKFFMDIMTPISKIKIDLINDDNYLILLADLPGIEKETIELTYVEELLTINILENSDKYSIESYMKKERRNNYQSRSFTISGIDFDNSVASYENGVLKLFLPKKIAPEGTKIKVN